MAFAIDVIQVATVHLRMCHIITSTVVYGLKLSASTLWNLFRGTVIFRLKEEITLTLRLGKCYNQLCNRNDKWHYEMDHLVLGTIFFTLASFLMPTILIYCTFFSCINYILYRSFSTFDRYCCKYL